MRHLYLYICDWLPPDFGAVGQYALEFARQQAEKGADVVLLGLSSEADSCAKEMLAAGGTLTVQRIRSDFYDRTSRRERLLWTAKTNFRLVLTATPYARRAIEVRFSGSPPFLLHFIFLGNLFWRTRLSYRITDFWPECLMAEMARVPPWLHWFWRLTCALRRRIDDFEVLGHDQQRRLEAVGVPAGRIRLRRNPVLVNFSGRERPLKVPDELDDRTILLYSGNWGAAHDVMTFVRGYIRHHRAGSARIGLWLNAVGSGADQVEEIIRSEELPIARTRPVPLSELPNLLVTAHAHLITLKNPFVGFVLPSKADACIASGRPILFVGNKESDVHLLCSSACSEYHHAEVGDVDGVVASLEALANQSKPEQHRPS